MHKDEMEAQGRLVDLGSRLMTHQAYFPVPVGQEDNKILRAFAHLLGAWVEPQTLEVLRLAMVVEVEVTTTLRVRVGMQGMVKPKLPTKMHFPTLTEAEEVMDSRMAVKVGMRILPPYVDLRKLTAGREGTGILLGKHLWPQANPAPRFRFFDRGPSVGAARVETPTPALGEKLKLLGEMLAMACGAAMRVVHSPSRFRPLVQVLHRPAPMPPAEWVVGPAPNEAVRVARHTLNRLTVAPERMLGPEVWAELKAVRAETQKEKVGMM